MNNIHNLKQFLVNQLIFYFLSIFYFKGTVSKHVQLVGELNRLVNAQNLYEISELEQNIVNNGEHIQCFESVKRLIKDSKTTELVLFIFYY